MMATADQRFLDYKERSEQQYEELKSLLLGLQSGTRSGQQNDGEQLQDNLHGTNMEKDQLQGSSCSENRINKSIPEDRTNKVAPTRMQKIPPRRQQTGGGREVALCSLAGSKTVAYGRLQRTDKAIICVDGLPLGEYCEVLVDVVLDNNVLLPRAQHRVTKLGAAVGLCVPWPHRNVMELDGSPLDLSNLNPTKRSIDFSKRT